MVKPVIKDLVQDMVLRKKALEYYEKLTVYQSTIKYLDSGDKKGIIKIIKWDTWGSITIIPVSSPSFQLWPRDGQVVPFTIQAEEESTTLQVSEFGGWYKGKSAWVDLLYQSAFPMFFDPYLGTFTASVGTKPIDKLPVSVAFNGGSMGNFYWTDGKQKFLNWNATPNRHFPLDSTYSIPGVTNDIKSKLFLPFNEYIYQGGLILARAPQSVALKDITTPNYLNLVAGAFYQDKTLYCIVYVYKTEGVYEEIYKAVGSKITLGEISDKGWQLLNSRVISRGLGKPYFISQDGLQAMAPDGVLLTITPDEVQLASTVLHATGTQSFKADNLDSMLFTKSGTKTVWPELADKVDVTYSAFSESNIGRDLAGTTKEVPIYLYGTPATSVEVTLGENKTIYTQVFGFPPPAGVRFFTAEAKPNSIFCNIQWSASALYGCTAPSITKASNGSAIYFAGDITHSCFDVNFRVTATTEHGATGYADYSKTICSSGNSNRIIQLSTNHFTYEGQITAANDSTILWTAVGATISGANNQQEVTLTNICFQYTLTVSGTCGTIIKTYGTPTTITISGPQAPVNGSQYTSTGIPPLVWSISKGSVSSSGVVSGINTQCGTAILTVTDVCNNIATKNLRMPTGVWIQTYGNTISSLTNTCSLDNPRICWYNVDTGESNSNAEIDTWTHYRTYQWAWKFSDYAGPNLGFGPIDCVPAHNIETPPFICLATIFSISEFTWSCP